MLCERGKERQVGVRIGVTVEWRAGLGIVEDFLSLSLSHRSAVELFVRRGVGR